jgi:GT2 family glycosyltransferase
VSAGPGVSVVVPTRDCGETLPALFDSLDRARGALPVPNEVIVVDDSRPAARVELERLCAQHDVRLLPGGRHVGAKRNLGAAAARFELLVFVDSDCRASAGLLLEHWRAHVAGGVAACAGPVEFAGRRSWLWPAMDHLGLTVTFGLPAVRSRLTWSPTANLSVSRRCFEAIGGFDESLPSPGGSEDVDLGLRLTARGLAIECSAQARAVHDTATWNSLPAMLRRMARYGRSEPRLIERHPTRAVTTFPGHLTLVALGAGLWLAIGLLGRGSPGPLLAALWVAAYWTAWTGRILRYGWPEPDMVLALVTSAALDAAHEAGRVVGAWTLRRPAWMVRRLMGSDEQPVGEWTGGTARARSWLLATVACAAAWIAMTR